MTKYTIGKAGALECFRCFVLGHSWGKWIGFAGLPGEGGVVGRMRTCRHCGIDAVEEWPRLSAQEKGAK